MEEKMERLARKIEFLENPKKRGDIPPKELLGMIPIKKTDTILDLGAGTGYITVPAARATAGMVYALDIDADMLDVIKSKAEKEKIENIIILKDSIDHIPLPDNSMDLTLASLVLHEMPSLPRALGQIKRVLKPGGYFVCIEFEKKDFPKERHPRISSSEMEEEIKLAGLNVSRKLFLTDAIYMIMAKK
ncbi:class I SAM-dependent methyltransferase [Cytobacillus sp. NJ13]|nr:class I SAM-dependent methyltransferase [Cytobacillus sp. NJ13]